MSLPAVDPPDGAPARLVGRDAELAALRGLAGAAAAGSGGAVLVVGEPGIGKSALLRAGLTGAGGCQLRWGVGDELGQAFPLLPFLHALDVRVGSPDRTRAEIARLLRGGPVRHTVPGGPDPVLAASERLLALVDDLCSAAPLLLVIDDLQWADETSVRLWQRLARSVDQIPLLLAGAMRPVPERDDLKALRRGVADLPGGPGVLSLKALAPGAVAELVSVRAGGAPGPALLRLAEDAAGNPLYLTELVDTLRRTGSLLRDETGALRPTSETAPGSLAAAIGGRLEFLPGAVRDVLSAASMLGVGFDIAELCQVVARPVAEVVGPLQLARAAGVLTDVEGVLEFRHPLIRQALYEQVPASARAVWHQDIARTLAGVDQPALRVARHLLASLAGSRPGEVQLAGWSVDWLVQHAAELLDQSPRVAADLLGRAGATLPAGDGRGSVLAARRAAALVRIGETGEAERVAEPALASVRDPDVLVDLLWTLTECRSVSGRLDELVSTLEAAAVRPGLGAGRVARLKILLARVYGTRAREADAGRLAREALALAREADDRWATAWATEVLGSTVSERGPTDEGLALHRQATAAAAADPTLTELRLLTLLNHAHAMYSLCRYDEAATLARELAHEAERVGSVRRMAQAHALASYLYYDTGQWDDALVQAETCSGDLPLYDQAVLSSLLALIALHRDEPAAAGEHLDAAAGACDELGASVPPAVLARALQQEQAGAVPDALATLTSAIEDNADSTYFIGTLLPDAVRLALATGDLAAAARLTGPAHAAADACTPELTVVAQLCRGLLDRDAGLLAEAVTGARALGLAEPQARAAEALAQVQVECGDLPGARSALSQALAVYESLGAVWDVGRVRANFRQLGIRRSPRPARRRADRGWASLTPTELRIAELVAEGLSNPQIAARLFLSRRTVQTHVSHILVKLDAQSRVDIAREAGRQEGG